MPRRKLAVPPNGGYCRREQDMNKLHYITSVTNNRVPVFRSDEICRIFIEQMKELKKRFPFKLIGYVLMPDHFHMIVDIHGGEVEKFLLRLRGMSARKIIDWLKDRGYFESLLKLKLPAIRKGNYQYAVWQPKPLVIDLFSPKFVRQKLDYIHMNPVRAGLCSHPADWKWSSYNAYAGKESPIEIDRWEGGQEPALKLAERRGGAWPRPERRTGRVK